MTFTTECHAYVVNNIKGKTARKLFTLAEIYVTVACRKGVVFVLSGERRQSRGEGEEKLFRATIYLRVRVTPPRALLARLYTPPPLQQSLKSGTFSASIQRILSTIQKSVK